MYQLPITTAKLLLATIAVRGVKQVWFHLQLTRDKNIPY